MQKHNSFNKGTRIAADPLLERINCTICMCRMTEPTMTKCGHTFCRGCVEEMINRFHRCPLCNHDLTVDDIFRNYDYEDLGNRIEEAKEAAVKQYLEGLAEGVVKDFGKEMGSLESVFVQNIQHSLLTFKEYQTNM